MKKLTILASLFLMVFGAALGITALTPDQAVAGVPCPEFCYYDLYCSWDTGTNCSNPSFPYYIYGENGYCSTGISSHVCLNGFWGCWNGTRCPQMIQFP